MKSKLKFLACAAAVSFLPMAASAMTFGGDSLQPGETFLFSSDQSDGIKDTITGNTVGDVAGQNYSYTFYIENDATSAYTFIFDLLYSNLNDLSVSLSGGPTNVTNDFTAFINAGETRDLTLSYTSDGSQRSFTLATLAAVPTPAAMLLMLSALGGLAVVRRRKGDMSAASAA